MAHAGPLVSTTLLPTSGLSVRQPMAYTGPDVGQSWHATSSKSVSDVRCSRWARPCRPIRLYRTVRRLD